MKRSAALLGSFVCLLLTGCPLTDHYVVTSEVAGNSGSDVGGDGDGLGGGTVGNTAGGGGVAGDGDVPTAGKTGLGAGGSGGIRAAAGMGTGGMIALGGSAGQTASGGAGGPGTAGNTGSAGTAGAGGCGDIKTDPMNCGACSNKCNVGRSCSGGVCQAGWVAMSVPPNIAARSRAGVVAMGDGVFIWGGLDGDGNALADGGIYYPKTDYWVPLPKGAGAPGPRITPGVVWTGSLVVVFGGSDANVATIFRDGGVYDPSANSWTALPSPMSLKPRNMPIAYWDGTRAVFISGSNASGPVGGADRFDLQSWTSSVNMGDPGALMYPAFAADGSTLYLEGGQLNNVRQDKTFSYASPAAGADKWTALSKPGLTARSSTFGAWDGSHFVVWGGRDDNTGLRNDGKYLSPATQTWTNVSVGASTPSPRMIATRRSGWSFQVKTGVVAFLGGQISTMAAATLSQDGATYNTVTSMWTAIPAWSATDLHEYGMGAWTGDEFVIWGGRDATKVTNTGQRWAP